MKKYLALAALVLLLQGCAGANNHQTIDTGLAPAPTEKPTLPVKPTKPIDTGLAKAPVGLPNPADKYCLEVGGQVINKTTAEGVRSVCQLKDGTQKDAWEYYREQIKR